MKRPWYVILLFLALFSGCTGSADVHEQQLCEAEEKNRTDVSLVPDSIHPLVEYYDGWQYRLRNLFDLSDVMNHRMRAYYMLGCAYRDQDNAPRALENYQQAVSMADTTDVHCDFDRLMRIHSQMSLLYLKQRLLDEEKKELDIAERLAWKIKDTLSALIFVEYKCHSLYNKGNYKDCLGETLKLVQKYKECGYKEESLLAYTYCINSCLALGDYTRMKNFISLYEKCAYLQSAPQRIAGGLSALYIFKGQYFLAVECADSASFYFQKALPYIQKGTSEMFTYKGLSQAYNLQHEADSVLKYTQLYAGAKEDNFDNEIVSATIQCKQLYDYNIEQKIAKDKSREASRLRSVIYLFIIIAAVCFAIALFFMFLHEKKKRKFRELQQEHLRATNTMLDMEEKLAHLRVEKTLDESSIARYVQNIEDLKYHISYLERAMLKSDGSQKREKLENSDIIKRFRDACIPTPRVDKSLSNQEWKKLQETVENIYPHFYDIMNGKRQLSSKDYRVCLLTLANFTASDIDNLMQQQPSYASATKKRLHKKVFGYEGTAADFDQKIHQA